MSTNQDLLRFQRALLAERANLLATPFPCATARHDDLPHRAPRRPPGTSPMTLVGYSGATGTWLFHCPELDPHLAGTIDQAEGRTLPFRLMGRMLRAWAS
jgi:D-alanyl-D-alanine carboxypeptidase